MQNKVTSYTLSDDEINVVYNDGKNSFKAKIWFNEQRRELRLYDVNKPNLSETEIAIFLNEFLSYYYIITNLYLSNNDIAIEDFAFLVKGYKVSRNNYDMLTYYIAEISAPPNECGNLLMVREAFEYIITNIDSFGKDTISINFKGKRVEFDDFYSDLTHVIENYKGLPEGISIVYSYKKRFINHEFLFSLKYNDI